MERTGNGTRRVDVKHENEVADGTAMSRQFGAIWSELCRQFVWSYGNRLASVESYVFRDACCVRPLTLVSGMHTHTHTDCVIKAEHWCG